MALAFSPLTKCPRATCRWCSVDASHAGRRRGLV